jgi:hypothetical protein
MVPGFDDAKTTEMRARLDDRLGLWAVTYLLFFVKLGPGLALFLALVFAIWIGWRWLCRKCPAVAWAVWWHVKAEGALVFVKACEMGLEGIVSKRAGSLYRSRTSRNWLKCRNPEFQRGDEPNGWKSQQIGRKSKRPQLVRSLELRRVAARGEFAQSDAGRRGDAAKPAARPMPPVLVPPPIEGNGRMMRAEIARQ